MGEIYRILFKSNDESTDKSGSLILKIPPRNLVRRKEFRSHELFFREITMYEEVRFNRFWLIPIEFTSFDTA